MKELSIKPTLKSSDPRCGTSQDSELEAVERLRERIGILKQEIYEDTLRWFEEQNPGPGDLYIPPDPQNPLGTGTLLRNYSRVQQPEPVDFDYYALSTDAQQMYICSAEQLIGEDEFAARAQRDGWNYEKARDELASHNILRYNIHGEVFIP